MGKTLGPVPTPAQVDVLGPIIILVRPQSVGTLRLGSKDPNVQPLVDPKCLTHPADIENFIDGIQLALKIIEEGKEFKSVGTVLEPNQSVLGCEDKEFRSRDYWACLIRHEARTILHYSGTCKMGKDATDATAVVDSKLRVLKVKGLRVIDSSIMPKVTSAHTHAAAVMIAELGSHFILNDSKS